MADDVVPTGIQMSGGAKVEGLDTALAEMKQLGADEGYAKGYAEGRAHAAKILSSEAAQGREAFAVKLAGDADLSTEKALDYLAEAPQARSGTKLSELMADRDPAVGAEPEVDPKQARIEQIRAAAARRGGR